MDAPFPIQAELTAIAIAYRNQRMIADDVLPRFLVGTQQFKYLKHDLGEGFTIPDTRAGRRSAVNEVEFTATEVTASTDDYALDDPIPQADIENAPPNFSPVDNAVMKITDLIVLDREKRTADLVFDATKYPGANQITLAGNAQWSDFANSDPIGDVLTALETPIMRPNVMVLGQAVYTKLSQHPDINKAVHGTSGDVGIARRQAIAELFELEEVLVGQGWLNTAKPGQAVTLQRVWGKHAALLVRDRLANARSGGTFGITAQWGSRIAGQEADSKIGMRGGQRVRAGESVKELITASDFGYFIEDAVA